MTRADVVIYSGPHRNWWLCVMRMALTKHFAADHAMLEGLVICLLVQRRFERHYHRPFSLFKYFSRIVIFANSNSSRCFYHVSSGYAQAGWSLGASKGPARPKESRNQGDQCSHRRQSFSGA